MLIVGHNNSDVSHKLSRFAGFPGCDDSRTVEDDAIPETKQTTDMLVTSATASFENGKVMMHVPLQRDHSFKHVN